MTQKIQDRLNEAIKTKESSLNLSGLELKKIPLELKKMTWLTILDLRYNQITTINGLDQLQNLTTLLLSNNQIRDINGLNELENLATLSLDSNQIKNITGLDELVNLTELRFSNNQITAISGLDKLESLTKLRLYSNQITAINGIDNLKNLKSLELYNNQITAINGLDNLKNLENLELDGNQITAINGIDNLKNLSTLGLSENQITVINGLNKLENLTELRLSSNQIINIKGLESLLNLKELDLENNQIISISGLEELQNLKVLDLESNQITNISGLEKLQNLTWLKLSNNQITSIKGLDNLQNLREIDLENNKITSISGLDNLQNLAGLRLESNQLKDLYPLINLFEKIEHISIKKVPAYEKTENTIHLYDNPITNPDLEIVGQGKEAILNYFKSLEEGEEDQIFEAKMLVLGGGGVGKTSLCKKIKNNNYELISEALGGKTTEGIDILDYRFPLIDNRDFKVNIWDFGGQAIYHATHQFFLTKRSLYVLVTDTRKEEEDLPFWLNIQQLLAGNSPMLIVQNEKFDRKKALKENEIRGAFKNVKAFYQTNLKDNRGLDKIVKEVQLELQKLDHIGSRLPKSWVEIRQDLESIDMPYITQNRYFDICATHGMVNEDGNVNRKRALHLSNYFHDLGVFLHFSKDPILQRIVILDNEWATDAVYKVMDNKKVNDHWGHFTFDDLENIWSEKKYEDKQVELETLMEKFKLCFELKDKKGYLAPQLLPEDRKVYDWGDTDSLYFKYVYEFMPKGLLSRLIVEMHQFIKGELIWRTGGVFEKEGAVAEVMEVYNKKEISIRIKGKNPEAFRAVIINEMDQVNAEFQDLNVEKLIPCNCKQCLISKVPVFHKEEKLMKYYQYRRYYFDCEPPSFAPVDILGLLSSLNNKIFLKEAVTAIRGYIKNGEIDKALALLLEKVDPSILNEVLIFHSRYSKVKKDLVNGLITKENFLVRETNISTSILLLLDEISHWYKKA